MTREARAVSLLVGALLCAAFFGLSRSGTGLGVGFHPPFSQSTPGEVQLWLSYALLLCPGGLLLGLGLSEPIGRLLRRLFDRADASEPRERVAAAATLFIAAFTVAYLLRAVFLLDLPITDDELCARFGGQILSRGHLAMPVPELFAAYPKLYLSLRHGMLSAITWPGVQLAWAFGELTGLGAATFTLVAAALPLAMAWLLTRRLGPAWGLCAAALAMLSPMAAALSMTSHAHVLSRTMLAVALCGYVAAKKSGSPAAWAGTGLAFGLGFLCRPPEVALLGAPLLLGELYDAHRDGRLARLLGGLLSGAAPALLVFALCNAAVTGHAWLPVRLAPNELPGPPGRLGMLASFTVPGLLWDRFGYNAGYNLFMLAVWFLGPIGMLLAGAGLLVDSFTRRLGLGVAALLALGLLHDNTGIHAVGPIHYSECVVPLAVIATHGLHRLVGLAREHRVPARPLVASLAGAIALGSTVFILYQSAALRRQADIQAHVYGALRGADKPSVVLAPKFATVWRSIPGLREPWTWVTEWRYPRPDGSDEQLVLHDLPGVVAQVRASFPQRPIYRLYTSQARPYLALRRVDTAGERRATSAGSPEAPGPSKGP